MGRFMCVPVRIHMQITKHSERSTAYESHHRSNLLIIKLINKKYKKIIYIGAKVRTQNF